ncbi:hypothetical protein BC835DRAFT_1336401 [Cytidiella melzeri]|nr:hypothetical protein BC835DRAFT_1336401 [Cytidiella melzeri]
MTSMSSEKVSSSPAPAKYVPRFKRDPTAVSSALTTYTYQDIAKKMPGQTQHTFVRAVVSQDAALDSDTTQDDSEGQASADLHRLDESFCRVMIHKHAHLSPPTELWTRNNMSMFDTNIGRPLPVFQELRANRFEFLGWYRITRWELCEGGSPVVRRFIERRKVSQRDRTLEYWQKALGESWARVEMERVRELTADPMRA